MFAYALNRCVAHELKLKCQLPKGTEITGFPNVANDSLFIDHHEKKYTLYKRYRENPRTIVHENDNMAWFLEKQFQGQKIQSFDENITIDKIIHTPDIEKKWIVTLGNFETGPQYLPYREKLKHWFTFPAVDLAKFEFFKLHDDLGKDNFFERVEFSKIDDDDLVISLRLEDYTTANNIDRLLDYDYFKIILESREWNNVYIITNPGSIGHNNQYQYLKLFKPFDPIIVRCYEPVMSMAFGAMFNNIAISQSTYSWWLAFLSNAERTYYPISKTGPFSLSDAKYFGTDLRVPSSDFIYVDHETRKILPDDMYSKIDCNNRSWTH
jgi:hypothetical protein